MNVLTFAEHLSASHLPLLKANQPLCPSPERPRVHQAPVCKVECERRNWAICLPQGAAQVRRALRPGFSQGAAQRSGELSGQAFYKSANFPKAW